LQIGYSCDVVTFGQKDPIGHKIHQELEKSTLTILAAPWLWFMKLQYQAFDLSADSKSGLSLEYLEISLQNL